MTPITPQKPSPEAQDSVLALAPKPSETEPDRGFDKVFNQTAREEEGRERDEQDSKQTEAKERNQETGKPKAGKAKPRAQEELTGLGHVHQLTSQTQAKTQAKAKTNSSTQGEKTLGTTVADKQEVTVATTKAKPAKQQPAETPSEAKAKNSDTATAEQQAVQAARTKAKTRQAARAAANQSLRQELKTEEQAKSAELRAQNAVAKPKLTAPVTGTQTAKPTASTAEEPINGTQVALNHSKMTMQAKQSAPQEVARPAMVEELRPATGADLAGQPGSQQQDLSRESAKEQPLPVAAVSSSTPAATGTAATQAFTPSAGVLTPMLEKIWNAVTTFRARGGDELVVKLQPNESTEVQLTVRYGKNGVEIQARMQQGDGQQLASGWQELQQSLADRGVNLGDLNAEKTDEESPRRESDARQFNRENQAEYRDTELEIGEDSQDWVSLGLTPNEEPQPTAETVRPEPAVPAHEGWQSWA